MLQQEQHRQADDLKNMGTGGGCSETIDELGDCLTEIFNKQSARNSKTSQTELICEIPTTL
jgi:hypothetical protein